MDKCTHEVRAQYWRKIVQSCQERPTGQSAKKWLEDNNISEQSYYSWQRKFRKEAYEQMDTSLPAVQQLSSEVSFTEISMPVQQVTPAKNILDDVKPSAVIKTATISIAITNDISEQLLSKILQEVVHA